MIEELKKYYEKNPRHSSYGGSEGEKVKGKIYVKWPDKEEAERLELGTVIVWQVEILASLDVPLVEGHCIVDALLDRKR